MLFVTFLFVLFIMHSASLYLLIGIFKSFTFKIIIDMLGFKFAIYLFVSLSHSSVTLFIPSCELTEHFLGFHLDLFIVFLSV